MLWCIRCFPWNISVKICHKFCTVWNSLQNLRPVFFFRCLSHACSRSVSRKSTTFRLHLGTFTQGFPKLNRREICQPPWEQPLALFFFSSLFLYKCFMKLLCHVALVPYSVFHGVLSDAGDEFITFPDLSVSFHPKERERRGRTKWRHGRAHLKGSVGKYGKLTIGRI